MAMQKDSKKVEVPKMGDDYESWKWEIELWKKVCGIPEDEQGIHIVLSLQGKAKEIVRCMKTADISDKKGVENILEELDKVFLADKTVRTFSKFIHILKYERDEDQDMDEHIMKFENEYRKFHELCSSGGLAEDTLKAFLLLK